MPNPLSSIDLSGLQNIPIGVLLMRAFFGILIIVAGRWFGKVVLGRVETLLLRHETDPTLVRFILSLTYPLILLIAVVIALGVLGINTSSLVALLGAVFLAIGLALQDSLKNFAAGVMLIFYRPFKVGDYVRFPDSEGTVESITLVNTMLRTPDNLSIIIPNGKISADTIVNLTANPTRRIDLVVGIGYDDDLRRAKTLLEQIVQDEPRVLETPAPVIAVAALADSSVNFDVRPWVKTSDYLAVKYALTEQIKLRFDAQGISIPFPQMDVHVHNGQANGQANGQTP
ncbi:MAG: mechanosensitive ion channel [Caldilineaceae bacterium]|nr:mechanosensitive ion channel [Caldilineaceae bacterium]